MIKIVNGKIVREGIVASAGSPVVQRRRCSIADLQLKEFAQETVAPTFEEEPAAITWSDILALQIRVFGVQLTAKNLAILSLVAFLWTGLTGLLVTLLGLYIGTVFSNNTQLSSAPVVEDLPKGSPSLNLSGNFGSSSPSLRSSTGSSSPQVLRVSGGGSSSPLLSRSMGSPVLSRPLHPRLVTLKSLELDSTAVTGTSA